MKSSETIIEIGSFDSDELADKFVEELRKTITGVGFNVCTKGIAIEKKEVTMREVITKCLSKERANELRKKESFTNSRAHVIFDEMTENDIRMSKEDWWVTFEILIQVLGMQTCEKMIEDILIEKVDWEVASEDDDEKYLEAVIGKWQLDWNINYVEGQQTITISEDMSQREDEEHVAVE